MKLAQFFATESLNGWWYKCIYVSFNQQTQTFFKFQNTRILSKCHEKLITKDSKNMPTSDDILPLKKVKVCYLVCYLLSVKVCYLI